jgi:hypothetical protein
MFLPVPSPEAYRHVKPPAWLQHAVKTTLCIVVNVSVYQRSECGYEHGRVGGVCDFIWQGGVCCLDEGTELVGEFSLRRRQCALEAFVSLVQH